LSAKAKKSGETVQNRNFCRLPAKRILQYRGTLFSENDDRYPLLSHVKMKLTD